MDCCRNCANADPFQTDILEDGEVYCEILEICVDIEDKCVRYHKRLEE